MSLPGGGALEEGLAKEKGSQQAPYSLPPAKEKRKKVWGPEKLQSQPGGGNHNQVTDTRQCEPVQQKEPEKESSHKREEELRSSSRRKPRRTSVDHLGRGRSSNKKVRGMDPDDISYFIITSFPRHLLHTDILHQVALFTLVVYCTRILKCLELNKRV
eukprot:1160896-Pelagomonas_calceolata.AAC.1